jgi:hypothetical protein
VHTGVHSAFSEAQNDQCNQISGKVFSLKIQSLHLDTCALDGIYHVTMRDSLLFNGMAAWKRAQHPETETGTLAWHS